MLLHLPTALPQIWCSTGKLLEITERPSSSTHVSASSILPGSNDNGINPPDLRPMGQVVGSNLEYFAVYLKLGQFNFFAYDSWDMYVLGY